MRGLSDPERLLAVCRGAAPHTWRLGRSGLDSERAQPVERKSEMTIDLVTIHWYDCNCDWLTKYCDEHHLRTARTPREILDRYTKEDDNDH